MSSQVGITLLAPTAFGERPEVVPSRRKPDVAASRLD